VFTSFKDNKYYFSPDIYIEIFVNVYTNMLHGSSTTVCLMDPKHTHTHKVTPAPYVSAILS